LVSEDREALLGQTMCHANGSFRNDTTMGTNTLDDHTVTLWAVRLAYYAMHYHQHRLAANEASKRYQENAKSCAPDFLRQNHNVNAFDYECPEAKHIILALGGNGLGSNVRGAMVPALLMGLTADRVVHFVNKAQKGDKYLRSPWLLSSCPRKDYQCFFMPTTPCILTVDEIADSYQLEKNELRDVTKRGDRPEAAEPHKVWTFQSRFKPEDHILVQARNRLRNYAQVLVDTVPQKNPKLTTLLNKAVEAIAQEDGKRKGEYNFISRNNKVSDRDARRH